MNKVVWLKDELEHFESLTEGRADAVLAASIFHFGTFTIAETKAYLQSKGIPVRPFQAAH
ncbi:MAG: hypothetical protein AUK35_07780 [Zetaproteobacteria bacterium CG2_30_46_52]|nr:MAG: hypothetical protein AUK35_07780 [Zetaproteobacteria bacterium CG2_30_46_52]